MRRSSRRRRSHITVTDQFCGAGGSSIGAVKAGLDVRLALNHWQLAIETHNTNFPNTDHDCTDVSAVDPRRYPSTDILITSPECTTHSPAGGSRRSAPQREMFVPQENDASLVRSRATMWDVPRFAEFHQYNVVIVENVLEVLRWPLFTTWLQAMDVLGYAYRIVCANSMFHHPTPQSRDRVYIVLWRKGNRAPVLEFTPPAFCPTCERIIESRQAWKPGRTLGKYRQQYTYLCPECTSEVRPFYFAALNAIDFSVPAERIGDRARPLKERTLERIRYGLEKYGRTYLLVRTNMTTDRGYGPGDGGRVRTATQPLPTQTASWLDALVSPSFLATAGSRETGPRGLDDPMPVLTASERLALCQAFLVETAYSHAPEGRVRGLDQPLMAQGTQLSAALVGLPFMVGLSNGNGHGMYSRAGSEPWPAQTTAQDQGVVIPPAALVANRSNNQPRSLAEPISVICTGGHQMLLMPASIVTLRGTRKARSLDEALGAQVASCAQDWLLSRTPFLVSYDRTNPPTGPTEPVKTLSTVDRHAVIEPDRDLRVEDCYFRMLQPHEIGAAMAFPGEYVVLGNKRDQVRQYGNAVTPPVMEWLIRQAVASLAPERAA